MQGIQVLDLKGDGSRDIVVDNEGLCGRHISGGNCSNRGCDFGIYKEGPKGQWRKIFDEHLYDKYLAIDWEHRRLQLMVVSISKNDPRCHPNKRLPDGAKLQSDSYLPQQQMELAVDPLS